MNKEKLDWINRANKNFEVVLSHNVILTKCAEKKYINYLCIQVTFIINIHWDVILNDTKFNLIDIFLVWWFMSK